MAPAGTDSYPLIDADAHVTEVPDIWTSRVAKRFIDQVPQAAQHPRTGHNHWKVGDYWFWPLAGGTFSQAGWPEHYPLQPWELEDADPAAWSVSQRLKRMDEFGIDVQILYPNLVGFLAAVFIPMDRELSVQIVRAWNDYVWEEWASADPQRLIPMAMVPFWDLDAAVAEVQRCVDLGFRGVLFANKFEKIGLPSHLDPHWDPLYAVAQECEVPINYHVGFGNLEDFMAEDRQAQIRTATPEERAQMAMFATTSIMMNDEVLGQMLTSGLCDRFPRLKLVNVETGFGHIPWFLEALDWHWKIFGNADSMELLPSEYFKRQVYGTHWFERSTLSGLEHYPDNFMFSTDYPHSTSLAPGPCGGTEMRPADYVADAYKDVDPVIRDKALFQNACDVYGIELPQRAAGPAPMQAI